MSTRRSVAFKLDAAPPWLLVFYAHNLQQRYIFNLQRGRLLPLDLEPVIDADQKS